MNVITSGGASFAVIDCTRKIICTQDILDLMAELWFSGQCTGMIVYKESLDERFFDLKTGFAGDVLQKFSNYNFKLAVVGDFSKYTSKSLRDFIYECNRGSLVFFASDVEAALKALGS
ncbi:MAG: DUF4180 domain-containing protein [Bacillota bacterium]